MLKRKYIFKKYLGTLVDYLALFEKGEGRKNKSKCSKE